MVKMMRIGMVAVALAGCASSNRIERTAAKHEAKAERLEASGNYYQASKERGAAQKQYSKANTRRGFEDVMPVVFH